ncbi:DUF4352 domain-containing protein [Thermoflavimicrobium dichotomicum]|uniref:DUF4352 domain-containing protein n=1 Tax=Thermoflavimicrobium dichotomicum TaxID=46223 RepID=UPI000B86AEF9
MNGQFDGEFAPGRKMKGELIFDVDKSEYYELILSEPFKNGQVFWKIDDVN